MSERIVDNPANHGWVEENGKWVWAGMDDIAGIIISDTEPTDKVEGMQWLDNTTGKVWIWDGSAWFQFPQGKDGAPGKDGNIADATEQGVIATWDNTAEKWTPEGAVVVSSDNVGIGTDSPSQKLHVYSDTNTYIDVERSSKGSGQVGVQLIGGRADGRTWTMYQDQNSNDLSFYTPGIGDALTIDASGNVGIGTDSPTMRLSVSHSGTGIENAVHIGLATIDRGLVLGTYSPSTRGDAAGVIAAQDTAGELRFRTGGNTDAETRLTIDATGNATFSGNVYSVSGLRASNWANEDDDNGLAILGNEVYPINGNNTQTTTGKLSLGDSTRMFKDAHFSDAVYVANSPLTRTRDLIETLATLRASTLDETVDVRQALASACDKLIEKFTEMQKTATQEVEDDS